MTEEIRIPWPPAEPKQLAARFIRIGWIGFFIQLALLAIPLLLALYVVLPGTGGGGMDVMDYLSYGSLLVMIFTTYWFFRYTQLGRRMRGTDPFPSKLTVVNTLWTGMWASFVGICLSIILLFSAASGLLVTLLATPQTGLIVAPPIGSDPSQAISALDVMSMNSLLITLAAELVVAGMTLSLLFQTTRPASSSK